jgi:hypothetical protein
MRAMGCRIVGAGTRRDTEAEIEERRENKAKLSADFKRQNTQPNLDRRK